MLIMATVGYGKSSDNKWGGTMGKFVHLHVHTEYSLLDGAGRIKDLIDAASRMDMPAIAITDHGVMYGVLDFYLEAKNKGIKPIIGCEVYVAPRSRFDREPKIDDKNYHLVLLAENQQGYYNLLKLVSLSFLEGFYYRPRVDYEILSKYSRGLIALSACLGGEIAQNILNDNYQGAKEACISYQNIFGAGNFFLELQDQKLEEQRKVNEGVLKLSQELNIPLVVTNDVHYTKREDAEIQDILLCVQTGKSVDDDDRMAFTTDQFYLKSPAEMETLWSQFPEAVENTLKIAERCNVEIATGGMHLPRYPIPQGESDDSYLRRLCLERIGTRYSSVTPEIEERLNYELNIIAKMGYSSYFLIVWDFIRFAREKGITVGPGRGSAAGSIVAYILGITNIDPLRYGLLFERFLNPERVSMPDIDIDFCDERRDEVIEYVISTYGKEKVAQIVTFGTMAARAAIRDVGRALNFPYNEVDRIAKMIPQELGMTIDKALQLNEELSAAYAENEGVQRLINIARGLEGIPRHASVHAAGVVISKEELTRYLPLQKNSDGSVTTQFTWENVEKLGLLKMDFLGLRTLTTIESTCRFLKENRGIEIDIDGIPLDDAKTYALLSSGDTLGVFQLESSGMRAILKELKPDKFEHIIAMVALYRPGPLGSGMVENFIRCRHGREKIKYLHPLLEEILQDTYGVILYQEQVMQIASKLAGFSLGQADLLRRAMGKKKPEVIAAQKENFLKGALNNGVERETALRIFELMEHFAGYGFNKSHSAAYALLAYQTAYLKANYPVEYMAALLSSFMNNTDKVAMYIMEAKQHGIDILAPDINRSSIGFTVENGKIRFGLAAIKNVGENILQEIVSVREREGDFTSFGDFCMKMSANLNRRVLESLIKAGAFDSLNRRRSQLFEGMENILAKASIRQKEKESGQISLLDFYGEEETVEEFTLPDIPEWREEEKLGFEKEVLGFYISGHPLAQYESVLRGNSCLSSVEIGEIEDGKDIAFGGMVVQRKQILTKKGEPMLFMTMEDLYGSVEVIVFPNTYRQCQHELTANIPLLIEGRLNKQEDEVKIIARTVRGISLSTAKDAGESERGKKIYIKIEDEENQKHIQQLMAILLKYRGGNPVYLCFAKSRRTILADERFWVKEDAAMLQEIAQLKYEYVVK